VPLPQEVLELAKAYRYLIDEADDAGQDDDD